MDNEWKRGLPPRKMTEENKQWFIDTFEVRCTMGGMIWYRKKK